MALFAQQFGQTSSYSQNNNFFQQFPESQSSNHVLFGNIDRQPTTNFAFPTAMKRKKPDDALDEPGAKRRHYEDKMALRMTSLDLSGESLQQRISDDDEEYPVEEIDPEILTESPPVLDDDENADEPIVEEPDEEDEVDGNADFIIADELKHYMRSSKHCPVLQKMKPKKPTGQELVVWRPPPLRVADFDEPKIEELEDEDVEIVDYKDPIPLPYTQQQVDESRFLHTSEGMVSFPIDEDSSERSSQSPPVSKIGYHAVPATTTPAVSAGEEPMDLD